MKEHKLFSCVFACFALPTIANEQPEIYKYADVVKSDTAGTIVEDTIMFNKCKYLHVDESCTKYSNDLTVTNFEPGVGIQTKIVRDKVEGNFQTQDCKVSKDGFWYGVDAVPVQAKVICNQEDMTDTFSFEWIVDANQDGLFDEHDPKYQGSSLEIDKISYGKNIKLEAKRDSEILFEYYEAPTVPIDAHLINSGYIFLSDGKIRKILRKGTLDKYDEYDGLETIDAPVKKIAYFDGDGEAILLENGKLILNGTAPQVVQDVEDFQISQWSSDLIAYLGEDENAELILTSEQASANALKYSWDRSDYSPDEVLIGVKEIVSSRKQLAFLKMMVPYFS